MLIGITAITSSLFYVYYKQPEKLIVNIGKKNFKKTVEIERINKIKALSVTIEQKEILVSRAIFIGCSQYMAELALGKPKIKFIGKDKDTWIYHFVGDNRPTALNFEKNELIGAEKTSVIDIKEKIKLSGDQSDKYPAKEYSVYYTDN